MVHSSDLSINDTILIVFRQILKSGRAEQQADRLDRGLAPIGLPKPRSNRPARWPGLNDVVRLYSSPDLSPFIALGSARSATLPVAISPLRIRTVEQATRTDRSS